MKQKARIFFLLTCLTFLCFWAELLSVFTVEMAFFHTLDYSSAQKTIHCLWISAVWLLCAFLLLRFSVKKYNVPDFSSDRKKTGIKGWIITILSLIGCKIITFIDWHTFKVIGEYRAKELPYFTAQYIYYFLEICLVCLIIIYGQETWEAYRKHESSIPVGGIVLALTWGAFHFFSNGNGLDVWNGVSCMIFALLSGIIYITNRKWLLLVYLLIAIGYLL